MKVDIDSKENHLLLNPKLPREAQEYFNSAWDYALKNLSLESHIGMATSGTTAGKDSFGKLVLLNKSAFLKSATSVNKHLSVSAKDIWLKALPSFHVGGLNISVRAKLSNSKVYEFTEEKWNAQNFYQSLKNSEATIISLVPTQIFDLLSLNLRSPSHLRAVLIGGAALSESVYQKAKSLGWNLLASYGMTETCSMIACAPTDSASLLPRPLSHAEVRLNTAGQIEISATSLLTAYVLKSEGKFEVFDPKVKDDNGENWFCSGDQAEINQNQEIRILGRGEDFVKVGGEGVSLLRLEDLLLKLSLQENSKHFDLALLAVPDQRLGHRIDLLCTAPTREEAAKIVEIFNKQVAGFEKIRQVHLVQQIPRTDLGKLKKQEALALVERLVQS